MIQIAIRQIKNKNTIKQSILICGQIRGELGVFFQDVNQWDLGLLQIFRYLNKNNWFNSAFLSPKFIYFIAKHYFEQRIA